MRFAANKLHSYDKELPTHMCKHERNAIYPHVLVAAIRIVSS
jgi:hypothetical protein